MSDEENVETNVPFKIHVGHMKSYNNKLYNTIKIPVITQMRYFNGYKQHQLNH